MYIVNSRFCILDSRAGWKGWKCLNCKCSLFLLFTSRMELRSALKLGCHRHNTQSYSFTSLMINSIAFSDLPGGGECSFRLTMHFLPFLNYTILMILQQIYLAFTIYCGFCLSRILLYFPVSVCVSVCPSVTGMTSQFFTFITCPSYTNHIFSESL